MSIVFRLRDDPEKYFKYTKMGRTVLLAPLPIRSNGLGLLSQILRLQIKTKVAKYSSHPNIKTKVTISVKTEKKNIFKYSNLHLWKTADQIPLARDETMLLASKNRRLNFNNLRYMP